MDLLELSDERDMHLRRLLAGHREAYQRGYAEGYAAGWLDCVADIKRAQQQLVRVFRDGAVRWVVRGQVRTRQTFADPHPADYLGRAG